MKRNFCIILFLVLFIASCHKDNNTAPTFTSASYPLAVGNWWQYQLTQQCCYPDTFMLSVVAVINVGPYTKYQCYFLYNGSVTDSGFFLQSDTSLSFTNTFAFAYYSPIPNFHIKFPAYTGQYWQGAFPGDSIVVDGVASSEGYYGHTYSPCYLTNESYDLPHNFKVESMTLTPKVGLVHQSINFQSDTAKVNGVAGVQVKQSIQLIDYYVQ
jgi:hypothetical protein